MDLELHSSTLVAGPLIPFQFNSQKHSMLGDTQYIY